MSALEDYSGLLMNYLSLDGDPSEEIDFLKKMNKESVNETSMSRNGQSKRTEYNLETLF